MALSSGQKAGAIAASLIVLVTAASVLALFVSGKKKDRRFMCRFNLLRLSQAMRFSNLGLADPAWDEMPTGSDFWASAPRWPGEKAFELTTSNLLCPVRGSKTGIDYRGPVASVRGMKPDDPVGADLPGNHGPEEGGNVLLRNGELVEAGPGHVSWVRAFDTTAK